ncbi:Hypothetical protein CINCED_3A008997 [Cinara cedri]|uniref:Uncharacterized protein n=1 Tax=Cinara cedri TaxID=506608 RepID=A0A5E4M2J2_9HEMI|nr:Hypothetical protein CINCED_3A008997 [Cinara cedri]
MVPNPCRDVCSPLEIYAGQQAVRLFISLALVGIITLLIAFITFYAFLYKRTDVNRRQSSVSLKYDMDKLCSLSFDYCVDEDDDDGEFDNDSSDQTQDDSSMSKKCEKNGV